MWAAEKEKRERESLEGGSISGRSIIATTEEINEHIYHMLMEDQRLSTNQIASVISQSCETVKKILSNGLGITNVSVRWLPHLALVRKCTRLMASSENLTGFQADPTNIRWVFCSSIWARQKMPIYAVEIPVITCSKAGQRPFHL